MDQQGIQKKSKGVFEKKVDAAYWYATDPSAESSRNRLNHSSLSAAAAISHTLSAARATTPPTAESPNVADEWADPSVAGIELASAPVAPTASPMAAAAAAAPVVAPAVTPATALAAAPIDLCVGARVQIEGLKKHSEYNGQVA